MTLWLAASTKLEGIVREANEQGGGYTTTIEGALKVNSATQKISNADGSFEVTKDGTVTLKLAKLHLPALQQI